MLNNMMKCVALCIVFGSLLSSSITGIAQEKGGWRPVSKTAESITGDVEFSADKITINLSGFTIAQIRRLSPAEINAAFAADSSAGGSGNLYRLSIPATKRFLHRNTLCGSEDTQWIATYVNGSSLQLAMFSGPNMPVLTPDALANTTDLCGTYSYAR